MLEHRIPPPVVAAVTAACMWALARWLPLLRFDLPGSLYLGLAISALGAILVILGAWEFRKAETTVNPLHPAQASSVVESGIYRFSRNPMYLGLLLVLIGCFVILGALGAVVGLPAFMLYITRFQIQPEERALCSKFGSAYTTYQTRVRRWL